MIQRVDLVVSEDQASCGPVDVRVRGLEGVLSHHSQEVPVQEDCPGIPRDLGDFLNIPVIAVVFLVEFYAGIQVQYGRFLSSTGIQHHQP